MLTPHTQIALSDALPGMTLSDPVLDTKGNILLPAGIVLTDALLASLQRHQIETIAIATAALSEAEADALLDRQIARVEWLFRKPGTPGTAGMPVAAAEPMPAATELLHQYILNFRSGMNP